MSPTAQAAPVWRRWRRWLPVEEVNPFEVYLLFAAEILGWTTLFGIARPTSVREALPPMLVRVWALTMALGGVASLLGLFWWGAVRNGYDLKRIGLVALASGALVYGTAALLLGAPGIGVAIWNLCFAAACLKAIRQMASRLRRLAGQTTGGAAS